MTSSPVDNAAEIPDFQTDPEGCFGCFNDTGYIERHDAYFIDSRSGRRFCAECVVVLASWELDGCPELDERSYTEWVNV